MNDVDLELVLRRTMRAHDHEAPTADLLTARRPVGRRRRTWAPPMLAAAVILLVVAGVASLGGPDPRPTTGPGTGAPATSGARPAPAACPATAPDGVPRRPTVPDAVARLVPGAVPQAAVVCAYRHVRGVADTPLTGTRTVTRPADIPAALSLLPSGDAASRPCSLVLTSADEDRYLLGLTYRDGILWVAAPGDHCAGSTNGAFTSPVNLGIAAAQAFDSGTWPQGPRSVDPCATIAVGRLGQERTLVPAGAIGLGICVYDPARDRVAGRGVVVRAGFDGLVAALDALPSRPSTAFCETFHDAPAPRFYRLAFRYPTGPPVEVTVNPGCRPAVDNSSLQAQDASSVVPLIERLVAGR